MIFAIAAAVLGFVAAVLGFVLAVIYNLRWDKLVEDERKEGKPWN